ncbi:MAG: acyl-CoA thioesterase [Candidatus Eiseniibacteriota bacterium]
MGETPTGFKHACEITVRYGETDQMGVAYYANHLDWFEVARTEWLRARGRTYRDIEAEGVFLPVVEAHVRYLASARYDDRLRLVTWIAELSRAVLRFDYRIERVGDEALLATGFTRHVFLDGAGRPIKVDGPLRALLDPGA